MLTGTGAFADLGNQLTYAVQAYQQISAIYKTAWRKLPTQGGKCSDFKQILQEPMGALQPGLPGPIMIPFEQYLIVLAWGRGHVCVFPETTTSPVWVPERLVRQYGGDHPMVQSACDGPKKRGSLAPGRCGKSIPRRGGK